MGGQERAGPHTSICWSPCEKMGIQHADTEFLLYKQGRTCLYHQTQRHMGTQGAHIQILDPMCVGKSCLHTHSEREPHVYQEVQSCSNIQHKLDSLTKAFPELPYPQSGLWS